MDSLHTRYRLTVEVLSPLHIGTGVTRNRDYEYVVQNGKTWVVNQDVLAASLQSESGEFDNTLLGRPASELLKPEDYWEDNPIFLYVIPGAPKNRPLAEQIKNVWGYPYLPGSSVKGALRTTLMWGIYTAEKRQPDLSRLDNRAKLAAQPLEQVMFAPAAQEPKLAPNLDVLRVMHVSDSEPQEKTTLHVVNAQIYPTGKERDAGVVVDLEIIQPGTTFTMTLDVEEYGFTYEKAQQTLRWEGLRKRLEQLPYLGKSHAGTLLADEIDYHKAHGPSITADFYGKSLVPLWERLQAGSEWLERIGFGVGWSSTTMGSHIRAQGEKVIADLVERYALKGKKKVDGRWVPRQHRAGQPFPASRHLVLSGGVPALPMGWVKCRLDPL